MAIKGYKLRRKVKTIDDVLAEEGILTVIESLKSNASKIDTLIAITITDGEAMISCSEPLGKWIISGILEDIKIQILLENELEV